MYIFWQQMFLQYLLRPIDTDHHQQKINFPFSMPIDFPSFSWCRNKLIIETFYCTLQPIVHAGRQNTVV